MFYCTENLQRYVNQQNKSRWNSFSPNTMHIMLEIVCISHTSHHVKLSYRNSGKWARDHRWKPS